MATTDCPTTDVLLHVVVTLLTPLFLPVTGDVDQAYAAALAAVRSCTARNPLDLLLISQVIAFGLATIDSVSLSMNDDIPTTLILRLRGNAVSLHRAGDRCRRALPDADPTVSDEAPLPAAGMQPEAAVVAEVEQGRKRGVAFQAAPAQRQAMPVPAPDLPLNDPAAHHATGLSPAALNLENNLRAACTLAFPDASPAEIDTMIEDAILGSRAAGSRSPSGPAALSTADPPSPAG